MKTYKDLKEFINYLEEPNSDYPWIAKDLPENPTLEQKLKFEICQQLIHYKNKHNLTYEQLSETILKNYQGNAESKTKKLLFCWIEEFDLKELIDYANIVGIELRTKFKEIEKEPLNNQLDKWDASLNDYKILEIIERRFNHKTFEPLPEPISLWNKELYFVATAYRGIKYKMIFILEGQSINLKNIWVYD